MKKVLTKRDNGCAVSNTIDSCNGNSDVSPPSGYTSDSVVLSANWEKARLTSEEMILISDSHSVTSQTRDTNSTSL